MRPQEIEKIARGVVSSFSPSAVTTGCGSFSPPAFTCEQAYSCEDNYECGGAAEFGCPQEFDCNSGFVCACTYTYD
jgi:hypothetical protein